MAKIYIVTTKSENSPVCSFCAKAPGARNYFLDPHEAAAFIQKKQDQRLQFQLAMAVRPLKIGGKELCDWFKKNNLGEFTEVDLEYGFKDVYSLYSHQLGAE